jgi:hypothetical protein
MQLARSRRRQTSPATDELLDSAESKGVFEQTKKALVAEMEVPVETGSHEAPTLRNMNTRQLFGFPDVPA